MSETAQVETLHFQAEVAKLLDIVVHALYSQKEIFLRELISNASDACDKLRYAAITEPHLIEGDSDYAVRLIPDETVKMLTIADNGIGMSRDELIENLGTIAHSGSQRFAQALAAQKEEGKSDTVNLIGQFGVGFYSAFMVAEKVDVISRKAGEEQGWKWSSNGTGEFTVEPYDSATRGTRIVLHMRDDALEYLNEGTLRRVVKTYSDHIDLPVKLEKDGKDDTINAASALWTRSKSDITDEQYKEFYHHVAHAFDEPWMTIHTKAEGMLEYTGLIFVPTERPYDMFEPDRKNRLKLYVRRVFITEDMDGMIPSYLRFLKGVVDTDDLPLNVSRETLQDNPLLKKIGKNLVNKVLGEIKKAARDEDNQDKYEAFWNTFGVVLKEGIYEDFERREDILNLCRFESSLKDGLISLDQYVAEMPEGQEHIYFLTGDSAESLRTNPQLEGFTDKGVNVLLLSDAIDEFWTGMMPPEFEGKKFVTVAGAGKDLSTIKGKDDDKAEDEKKDDDIQQDDAVKLASAMLDIYGAEVSEVRVSTRLTSSPVCLVAGDSGVSLHLERLLKANNRTDGKAERVLEINPKHPIIKALIPRVDDEAAKDDLRDAAWLLLDQARIIEGETVTDVATFTQRLNSLMTKVL